MGGTRTDTVARGTNLKNGGTIHASCQLLLICFSAIRVTCFTSECALQASAHYKRVRTLLTFCNA
jgi:hypothetical protein